MDTSSGTSIMGEGLVNNIICSKCGISFPATEEYFQLRTDKNILRKQCRDCRKKIRRANYETNREKILEQSKNWKVEHKEQRQETHRKWYEEKRDSILEKSRAWHHKTKHLFVENKRQYRIANKEKISERRKNDHERKREYDLELNKKWYQNNKEKHLNDIKLWRRKNKDKATIIINNYRARKAKAGGTFTKEDIDKKLSYQNNLCWWCDKEMNKKYSIDHIIPLSRGGSNYPDNIVICCISCNASKGNKLPNEWKGFQEDYSFGLSGLGVYP